MRHITLIRELRMDYITLKLPAPFGEQIDDFRERNPEFFSRADVVKMILRAFFNGGLNYQSNREERNLPEGGEEKQSEGGRKHESLDNSGRSPQKTQSDTVRLSDKQNQPQPATTKRTPDQQRETQKEKIKGIGGEDPYEGRIKENRNI